jgi:hypothetical protein
MKKLIALILALIITGPLTLRAGEKQLPPQTDEQLRKLIVGYWLIEYKDSMGILWRGTETIALDGSFGYRIALITGAIEQDITWGGIWQIEGGIFTEKVTHSLVFRGPEIGTVTREKIILVDSQQRVVRDEKGKFAKRPRIRAPLP